MKRNNLINLYFYDFIQNDWIQNIDVGTNIQEEILQLKLYMTR